MSTFIDIFLHERIFGRTLAMRSFMALVFGLLVIAVSWWLMGAIHWGYAGIAAALGLAAKSFGADETDSLHGGSADDENGRYFHSAESIGKLSYFED